MRHLEISDLITAVEPRNGRRLPVRRADVVRQLRASGDERAARIVGGLPVDGDGVLDPDAVDGLLISVHTELQQLSEELRIGERLVHVLGPLFTAIRTATGQPGPYRLVDIGCGLGYLVRWLAATGKHRPAVRAALRGTAVGALLLLASALTAVMLLLTAPDHARTYATLAAGGNGFLLPLIPYAAAVLLSLAAYFTLPFRAGTLAMVIGLGPLTLLRPLAVAAGCLGAVLNGGGASGLLVGAVAGGAVLCVEPLVHRRWYRRVQ
ncbi:hypothetical protein ACIG0C_02955 [Kitasatospora aureofaciens]|uniref:hypothetical protein n=1 Tax=Kitasatospora aureofaciens TaxID=1894 RepID=UPI00061DC211|nr:hypothetical protein [Kitasatospora aureofaciens]UKZ05971.1 SAM-dependent methyltransferase [Streptomyces viridifaciens]